MRAALERDVPMLAICRGSQVLNVVRGGDTWQSIADRSGGVIKPSTLAVMNDATPNSQPAVGTRIKIVVGG